MDEKITGIILTGGAGTRLYSLAIVTSFVCYIVVMISFIIVSRMYH